MKHTFILLALCALFASCGNGGEIAKLQKENDSLRSLLGKNGSIIPKNKPSTTSTQIVMPNDTSLIQIDIARSQVQNFQAIMTNNNLPNSMDTAGFIIPLSEIDSIQKYFCDTCPVQTATALLIYPAINQNGRLTIVYSPLSGTTGKYTVLYPTTNDGTKLVFDHILPCPECGISGAMARIRP